MTNSERYKDALEKIDKISFSTGRADLLGKRVKEVIRKAIHPDETCPECKGTGEVPNHSTDCGSCTSWNCTGPYSGICKKNIKQNIDECDPRCSEGFEYSVPMLTCTTCNGESVQYEEEVVVASHGKQDFSAVKIDID